MKNDNHNFTTIGDCAIHDTAKICKGAIIGKPFRRFLDGTQENMEKTFIGQQTYIGYYSIIGNGSIVSSSSIIDDYCIIESRVQIGSSSLIIYRAQMCNDVSIGSNCVIGSFIGERTIIGNNCRVFGKIVHSHINPSLAWDDDEVMEESPNIGNSVFIGFNSLVAGRIKIGNRVYICAGAIVTKDVPDFHIVSNMNNIIHYTKWRGSLKRSSFFTDKND